MNSTTAAVAANVKKALDDEGYTAQDIATRINVSYSQATRLISGKSAWKPEYIGELARMLGKDPEVLVGANEHKDNDYLTVNEAAAASKYSVDYVRKACYHGVLNSSQRVKGGKYLIREIDLAAWMAGVR